MKDSYWQFKIGFKRAVLKYIVKLMLMLHSINTIQDCVSINKDIIDPCLFF